MDSGKVFDNQYYKLNRFMLKCALLWPYQENFKKIIGRTFLSLTMFTMMLAQLIRMIEEILKEVTNMQIILENITGFIYFLGVLAKYFTSMIAEKKFQYLYEEISRDWKEIKDVGEIQVLTTFASTGRLLTIYYSVYTYVSCVLYIAIPAVVPMALNIILPRNESFKKALCIYAEYFVDEEKYFFYLFTQTLMAGLATICVTSAIDGTFVNCVQHVLGLFSITRFADLIKTAYNVVFFFVSGCLVIGLSTFTVDLVLNIDKPIDFLRVFSLWLGLIIYMFYVSWPGQKLIDTSDDVFRAIYASGWYGYPLKTQILIKIMMMRAMIPCRLTAGPLLDMNLKSCSLILKSVLSYFTVVASMS